MRCGPACGAGHGAWAGGQGLGDALSIASRFGGQSLPRRVLNLSLLGIDGQSTSPASVEPCSLSLRLLATVGQCYVSVSVSECWLFLGRARVGVIVARRRGFWPGGMGRSRCSAHVVRGGFLFWLIGSRMCASIL